MYYSPYFYSFFPNFYFKRNSINPSLTQNYFFFATLAQGRALRRNHLDHLVRKPALVIDCFTDVSPHFLLNKHYESTLRSINLWHEQTPHLHQLRNLLNELFLYPREPLCSLANSYISRLLRKVFIGVQVRIGGQRYFKEDRRFLYMANVSLFFNAIDGFVRRSSIQPRDFQIFVSTDTPSVISYFQNRYPGKVVTVSEFQIGHSARAKSMFQGHGEQFTQRAIVDLLILQRADFLVVTKDSSFGTLATQLQSNRNSSVNLLDFIQGDSKFPCTVFERSNRTYESVFIGPKCLCL